MILSRKEFIPHNMLFLISIILFELQRNAAATSIVIMVGVASRRPNNNTLFCEYSSGYFQEVLSEFAQLNSLASGGEVDVMIDRTYCKQVVLKK